MFERFFNSVFHPRVNQPVLVNILVRTSKRPNYFETCMQSIYSQSYPAIRILVSCDNEETFSYLKKYQGIEVVRVKPNTGPCEPLPDDYPYDSYRFPANLHLNALMDQVKDGFIMFLDDDDLLLHPGALKAIVHSGYIPFATWDGWSGCDYRVASRLYRKVPRKKFIDMTLTGLQRNYRHGGLGKQTDKTE